MNSLSTGLANAVMYDDASHSKVTLGGSGHAPVTLTNVANGTSQFDAVNFGQLSSLSSSASTGMNSMSTAISSSNGNFDSLSSSVTSLSTGVSSLSTG
ncbi:hypothetical protein, partial [Caballeronia sp. INDeC2]|uniref:hypothetical protein n=1 Tax=Caballeronia sp. INDeC2 TaxID=2921747 RepID=UPI0020286B9B